MRLFFYAVLPTLCVALPVLVLWQLGVPGYRVFSSANYLAFHTTVELTSAAVSLCVFFVSWYTSARTHDWVDALVGVAFGAVAAIDILHALSYTGMPQFITPNDPNKATAYWIAARLLQASALTLVAFVPSAPGRRAFLRPLLAGGALVLVGLIFYVVTYAPDLVPLLLTAERGLTPTKVALEYMIIAIALLGIVKFALHCVHGDDDAAGPLLMALIFFVFSEAAFTSYVRVSDTYNALGHVLKIASVGAVLIGLIRNRVQAPYIALLRSEQRWRSYLENALDVVTVVNREGLILYESPAMTRLLGHAIAGRLGRSALELVHPDDQAGALAAITRGFAAPGTPDTFRCRLRHEDGGWRIFDAVGQVFVDETGQALGVINSRDVTDQQRTEDLLRQQREALYQRERLASMGQLLAGVAHELNNPLAVVLGRASLLRNQVGESPLKQQAGKIIDATERCVRIVRNFLALARQRPPERTEVLLNQILKEAIELVGYPLRVDNIEVVLDLDENLPPFAGDPHQLHQIIVNLVTNAHQALRTAAVPRRLTLTTRFDPRPSRVSLSVTDTGPGIGPEVQERMFEPFVTTKPVGEGTGLGLALCRAIVEGHGGSIRAESRTGHGAVFTVELPVEAPPVATSSAPTTSIVTHPARTILIVDDEVEVANTFKEILVADGHHVDLAHDGMEALECLGRHTYDVILSDMKMPNLDGPGLYREISARHPDLLQRIILLTGDSLSRDVSEFLASAGRPILAKPFDADALRVCINEVIVAASMVH